MVRDEDILRARPNAFATAKKSTKSLLVGIFYASCLLLVGLIRDNRSQPSLFIDVSAFLRFPINADPRTFASAALEIFRHGWLTPESEWVFRLWPPGFVFLEATIFRLFGLGAPFLAILFALSILLGALMLATARAYLRHYVPAIWATTLPLLPFLFPVTRFFLLQPVGLAFGEGFSVMFFITGMFLVLLAARESRISKAVAAGACFAMASFFRSQYEMILLFMSLGAALVAIGMVFKIKTEGSSPRTAWRNGALQAIFASVIVAQLLMFPWRIHNFRDTGKLGWVQTQDLIARNSLSSEEKLKEVNGDFVILGGGHLACLFEPTYCGSADYSLFYKAFFKNPGAWYGYKISILDDFWFPSVEFFPMPIRPGVVVDRLGNWLVICSMLAAVALLWIARRRKSFPIFLWIMGSFYGCFFAIFTLVQFEVRYFYLTKIFALFIVMALGCVAWNGRRGSARPPGQAGIEFIGTSRMSLEK